MKKHEPKQISMKKNRLFSWWILFRFSCENEGEKTWKTENWQEIVNLIGGTQNISQIQVVIGAKAGQ
ncbi:hypothetical protein [Bacillus sp. NMCN1]|uniref:hypothetical protein n=1 Tax=Bacillus sp. NMCN1 TaxID=2108536 RepID=UPI001670B7DF|nr:hypothetical protein [Bacillus sp. NMCN1]